MELLFTDSTGNAEIKELLGFIDVDIPYKNLKSKIRTATNDIISLIGADTYALAVVEYKKSGSNNTKNNDFIFAVRYPIMVQAYRKYAPHNDVSHTNQGRLNRLEDKQKSAFQWQVDNDNEALERSYYEALDDLIKYLDANITPWKQTPQYKKANNLLIANTEEFDDIFPIGNSRLLFLKLAPGIKKCQDAHIKAALGKDLFDTLKATPSDHQELSEKVKETCAFFALAWAMRRMSVKLFPEGVLQGFKSDRIHGKAQKAAENNEAYAVAYFFNEDFEQCMLDLESIVTEINKSEDEVIEPLTFKTSSDQKFIST